MKIVLLLLAAAGLAACGATAPAYNITPTKPEDTITYSWANDTATFDITSPSGIDGARFVRSSGSMPKRLLMQLRLKGLESFKFRFGDDEVTVSLSSSKDPNVIQSARIDGGAEMELAPDSEYRMPVEIVSVSESVPLIDGYIQVEAPPAFYASDAREFSIEWIDFFR